jgi:hypothetical protein
LFVFSYSVTTADELDSAASSSDEMVLNAVKSIRSQLADCNKLLAQAQSLQAKLVEKVTNKKKKKKIE